MEMAASGLVIWAVLCLNIMEVLPFFVPPAGPPAGPPAPPEHPAPNTTTTTTVTGDYQMTGEMIRLVNGTEDGCSGRVEVFLQGEWGSVCDDRWDMRDARVVCRMLGCGPPVQALTGGHYGPSSGPIWLDNVGCDGDETSLAECDMQEPGDHNCDHSEDAGVMCHDHDYEWPATTPSATPPPDRASSGEMIRLVNGTEDGCSGRVEVYLQGEWGSVCDDRWDMDDARVVCRMLGCGPAVRALTDGHYGPSSGPIWLDNVGCDGDETSMEECDMQEPGDHNCDHSEDAGVMCQGHDYEWTTTPTSSVDVPTGTYQMIRLVNGTDGCSGRVEVFHEGQWGSVCDDQWDMDDARVVCREVGCGAALHAASRATFGRSSGPIWLDNVQCMGDEYSLSQCEMPHLGRHNCGHDEDAGVICEVRSDSTTTTTTTTEAPAEDAVTGEPLSLHANFMMGRSGEVRGSVDPVLLDMVISDTASGFIKEEAFGYNKDTGLYTAPFSGGYSVTVTSVLCLGSPNAAWDMMVDGQAETSCSLQVGVVGVPCTHDYWLEKGQTLGIRMRSGCVWGLTMSGTAWESEHFDYWYYYWNYW